MRPTSKTIPKRFPVVLEDRILYWMQKSHCSNFGIIAKFRGHLDFDRLQKAMRLCLDAEPILGCRFVNRPGRQYWERLPDLDAQEICTLTLKSEFQGNPARFLDTMPGIDVHKGPQARAWVLRDKTDILCLRINHVVGDGGGAKDLAYLLADTYNRLESDPGYVPPSNSKGDRSLGQVIRHLNMRDYVGLCRRAFQDAYGFIKGRSPRNHPLPFCQPRGYSLLTRVVDPQRFAQLKAYGKSRGATVNDILVAAMLRSFYTVVNPDPEAFLRMVTTADLRRYIPGEQAEAVCNLSGFSYINMGQTLPDSFDSLLGLVSRTFSTLKQDYIGLGSIPLTAATFRTMPFSMGLWLHDLMGDFLKRRAASTGDVALLFTNAGKINPEKFRFGNLPISWAGVTATRSTPPVLTVCISGFSDSLLITAGFCQSTLSETRAAMLLERLEHEMTLLEGKAV
ncbi:MAG: hypothetical protein JEZ02_21750 [Desulfatibacillum sp.]|nr:hypothetical protein [Desulfatibacillum sp.]